MASSNSSEPELSREEAIIDKMLLKGEQEDGIVYGTSDLHSY